MDQERDFIAFSENFWLHAFISIIQSSPDKGLEPPLISPAQTPAMKPALDVCVCVCVCVCTSPGEACKFALPLHPSLPPSLPPSLYMYIDINLDIYTLDKQTSSLSCTSRPLQTVVLTPDTLVDSMSWLGKPQVFWSANNFSIDLCPCKLV
jgi:hypothetical protein